MIKTISILFDESYSEPALVTAHQVIKSGLDFNRLLLIYAPSGISSRVLPEQSDSDQTLYNIQNFLNTCDPVRHRATGIIVKGETAFDSFSYAHFNSSIIKKIFIPNILGSVASDEVIINLDAGFILGSEAVQTLTQIFDKTHKSNALLAAFCHRFDQSFFDYEEFLNRFSIRSLVKPPSLYPAGTVLAFNCARWFEQSFINRILNTLSHNLDKLRMAEQEILFLSCDQGELLDLNDVFGKSNIKDPFVAAYVNGPPDMDPQKILCTLHRGDFGLFKIVGSFKPWHREFYDPIKRFYLEKAAALYESVPALDPESFAKYREFSRSQHGKLTLNALTKLKLESAFYSTLLPHLPNE